MNAVESIERSANVLGLAAASGSAALAAALPREYFSLRLGAEEYGIDFLKMQEIRGYQPLTRIAGAPCFIKGVTNQRGFAVVASEVRSLASRSAEAATEIKSLITASVERVEHGTALVDQAAITMTETASAIKRVIDIMGEISVASTEPSAGVSQVGEALCRMDQVPQQDAALVAESAAAAERLAGQAQQLARAVARFQLAHQNAVHQAATAPAPSHAAVIERRGPDRAKNWTRPEFGAKATVATRREQVAAAEARGAQPAKNKTATDNDWTSF